MDDTTLSSPAVAHGPLHARPVTAVRIFVARTLGRSDAHFRDRKRRRAIQESIHVRGVALLLSALLVTLLGVALAPSASAAGFTPSTNPSSLALDFQVTGTVHAIARDADIAYIGGDFITTGGSTRNRLAAIDTSNSSVQSFNPNVNGIVRALAIDNTARILYLGGDFTSVAGQTRNRIAAVSTVDGSLLTWNPNSSGSVYSLTLDASGNIYAGGLFATIGGQTRANVARLSTTTSVADSWNPAPNNLVRSIELDSINSRVYLGGSFTTVLATTRNRVARVSTTNVLDAAWNPAADNTVYSMQIDTTANILYLGGDFGVIGGATRVRIAALNAITASAGTATTWNPAASANTVRSVLLDATNGTIYVGGDFTSINGISRVRIAAVPTTSNYPTSWSPNADNSVYAIVLDASQNYIYTGGSFTTLAGAYRDAFGKLIGSPTQTTLGLNSTLGIDGTVYAQIKIANTLYIGGDFTYVQGQARNRLAAINLSDNSVTSWDPNANNIVYAFATDGSGILYAGGAFTTLGVTTRNRIASFTTSDGLLTSWDPNASTASSIVLTILADPANSLVYVGGSFTTIGGQTRTRLGAVSSTTGLANSFNPVVNNSVRTMVLDGAGLLYFGGDFNGVNAVGSLTRNRLAAVDISTSIGTSFDPNMNNLTFGIALDKTVSPFRLYAVGQFTTANAVTRNRAASWDVNSSTASAWNPNFNNVSYAIVLDAANSRVFVGGSSTTANAIARVRIAAFSTGNTATLLSWNPDTVGLNNVVRALEYDAVGSTMYIGGLFRLLNTSLAEGMVYATTPTSGTGAFINPGFNFATTLGSNFILASVRSGVTLYFGGTFTHVNGYSRNRLAAIDTNTGALASWNPDFNNTVRTLALDTANNRIFVGGDYTTVGVLARNRLAAIDLTTSIASTWDPNLNSPVYALSLDVGANRIYVGGSFTTVNGATSRARLASFPLNSNTVTSWNPNVADFIVYTVVVDTANDIVYAGGTFTLVNGTTSRSHAAAFPISSNTTTAWDPAPTVNVLSMKLDTTNNLLYLGGNFTTVSALTRNRLVRFDATSRVLPVIDSTWNPNVDAQIWDLQLDVVNAIIYAGGSFANIGGTPRADIGAISTTDGTPLLWNPSANAVVYSIALELPSNQVSVGGQFTTVSGLGRIGVANLRGLGVDPLDVAGNFVALSTTISGASPITAFVRDGNTLYVGGNFTHVNGISRRRLAAIDLNSNTLTSWDPQANAQVRALALDSSGNRLYVGGDFTYLGGQPRTRLAALTTSTGAVLAWDAVANSSVYSLALDTANSLLYAGGSYTIIGGQTRNRIAALSTSTALANTWNPSASTASSFVYTMALNVSANTIFIGGTFTTVGGATRNRIAALDTTSNVALAWNANAGSTVNSLALDTANSRLYAGGAFTTIGGQTRNRLAAIDTTAATATSWNPNLDNNVNMLQYDVAADTVYIAGIFTTVNAVARARLASITAISNSPTSWAPVPDIAPTAVLATSDRVFAGGGFTTIAGQPRMGVTSFTGLAPPTNVSAPTLSGTPQQGQLLTGSVGSWTSAPTGYAYTWSRCDAAGANCTTIGGAVATTYTLVLADVDKTIRFNVIATNADGSSPSSASAQTAAVTPPNPLAPTALAATSGNTQVGLSWSSVAGATSYKIYRDAVVVQTQAGTTWTNTGLTNGTSYAFKVRAVDSYAQESVDSSVVNSTPLPPALAAPTGLAATIGNAQVGLTWSTVAGATTYKLYRDAILIYTSATASYTDTGRSNGVSYAYTVRAVDSFAQDGTLSSPVNAIPLPPVPAAPTGVIATSGNTQVVVGWNAVAGATSYSVYRDGVLAATVGTLSFTDTGLTNGVQYAYYVRAVDAYSQVSPNSSTVNSTPLPPPPNAPTGLTATSGNAQISLSWTAVGGATNYKVFRDGVLVQTQVGTSWVNTGLTNGQSYSFYVRAVDTYSQDSANSSTASATPLPPPPLAPGGVQATSGDTQVALSWNTVSGASTYRVYRDGAVIATVATLTYNNTGLTNGTSYAFKVVATDAFGQDSPDSTIVNSTPLPPAPAAPAGLSATAGDSQVSINFSSVASATSYKIYRDGALVRTQAGTSWINTGLTNGTTYSFVVRAADTFAQESPDSGAVTARPLPPAPTAPTGFSATAGNTQVSLSWTSVAGATSYTVYRDGGLVRTQAGTSWINTGLTNGTTYSFIVRAVDTFGQVSPDSSTASARPLPPVPGAPTGLSATAGDTQASLTWNAVAGATNYNVYRGGVLLTNVAGTSYLNTGLTNGQSYAYNVTALDTFAQESAQSSTANATPLPPLPGTPTGFTVTAGNAQVTLNWTSVAGATSYDVRRDGILIANVATATYLDTGLTNGTTYSYTLKSVDSFAQRSAATSAVTARPLPPAPSAPTGFTATAGDSHAVTAWNATSGATSYRLYRDNVLINTTSLLTIDDTSLTNGTTYVYYVQALDTFGQLSPPSTNQSARPLPSVPGAPTGVSATAGNTQVTVNWSSVAGATSYNVYRNGVVIANTASTNLVNTGLTNGTTYSYRISAIDTFAQESALSSAVAATPLPPVPGAPTGFTGTPGDSQATLSWNAVSGASTYNVYRNGVLLINVATLTHLNTGLTNGTTYSYRVSAVDAFAQESAQSSAISVRPLPALPSAPATLTATSGNAQVGLAWSSVSGVAGYRVYINGVYSSSTTSTTLIVAGLTNGVAYTFTVKSEDAFTQLSSASPTATTTPLPPPPTTPTGLVAASGDTQVNLTWNDVTTATIYHVYVNNALAQNVSASNATITGLTNGTSYAFDVSAEDVYGQVSTRSSAENTVPLPNPPVAPANFTTVSGDSIVSLNWDDLTGAIYYEVYVNGSQVATVTASEYDVTGLTNGSTYSFAVHAVDTYAQVGNDAGPLSAVPFPAAPGAPTNLSAIASDHQIDFGFDPLSGAVSYQISIDGAAPFVVPTNSYSASGLVNGQSYGLRARGVDAFAQVGSWSSTISATPVPPTLGAPAGLAGTAGPQQVALTWLAVSSAASYRVYVDGVQVSDNPALSATVISLTNGQSYAFTIATVDAFGRVGAQSSPVNAVPLPAIPAAPTGLSATASNQQIVFSWLAVSGATSYKVYLDGALISTQPGLSYVAAGLTNGQTYALRVLAIDAFAQASSLSATLNATPLPPLPAAPTGLVAVGSNNLISVSWNAVSAAITYQILVDGTVVATQSSTTLLLSSMTNGTSYSIRVRSVDAYAQLGPLSSSATATPLPPAPPPPTAITATPGNALVDVGWTGNLAAQSYRVFKDGTLAATVTTFTATITALTNATTYGFRVAGVNAGGQGPLSLSASATPQAPQNGGAGTGGPSASPIVTNPPNATPSTPRTPGSITSPTVTNPSNTVVVVPSTPTTLPGVITSIPVGELPSPADLRAASKNNRLHLVWAAPSLRDGQNFVGYEILVRGNVVDRVGRETTTYDLDNADQFDASDVSVRAYTENSVGQAISPASVSASSLGLDKNDSVLARDAFVWFLMGLFVALGAAGIGYLVIRRRRRHHTA